MDSVMANQVDEKQWYLAVGERSLGPISTDLVTRGIRSGKVPVTAWVCQVGDNSWSALSSFGEFQEAVELFLATSVPANEESTTSCEPAEAVEQRSADEANQVDWSIPTVASDAGAVTSEGLAPVVDNSDEDEETGKHSLLPYERVSNNPDPLPSFASELAAAPNVFSSALGEEELGRDAQNSDSDISGQREVDPAMRQEAAAVMQTNPDGVGTGAATETLPIIKRTTQASFDDLGIDITFDEDEQNAIDWKERFQSYFLVGTQIQLPEEAKLLQSLEETPMLTFLHDEALWNLSLCLAFGSEVVAMASALKFYDALELEQEATRAPERVEWICRTLLSKGFMPSGIPRMEGNRGVDMLRRVCPGELREVIEREASN